MSSRAMSVPQVKKRNLTAPDVTLDFIRRAAHSATLLGSKIYILGGLRDGYVVQTDLMILDLIANEWRVLDFSDIAENIEAFGLFAHSVTLVNDTFYVIGGSEGVQVVSLSDRVYSFDTVLEEFRVVQTRGSPERGPVRFHSANLLPDSNEIVVYGGQSQETKMCEQPLFSFNAVSMKWTHLQWKGTMPPNRGNHATCLVNKRLYIYGGFAHNDEILDDLHILDFTTHVPDFSQPNVSWPPAQRYGTSLFYCRGNLFLFGGRTSLQDGNDELRLNDLHRFDIVNEQWNQCPEWSKPWLPRPSSNHKDVPLHDKVIIIGGTAFNLITYMEITFVFE